VTADARGLAFDLLTSVLRDRQPLETAFEAHPWTARLDVRDRAFARLLTATALRRLGQIDRVIASLVTRPPAAAVTMLLRLGLAQSLFLATPPHAAVNETVALARRRVAAGLVPLVNAVLRRAVVGGIPADGDDAGQRNTPPWLWQRWCHTYGETTARRIAAANLREPPLDLTARNDAASVAAMTGGRVVVSGSVRLAGSAVVAALPGYREGAWWVQDVAAALPARLLGDVRGRRVVDLCAAPGGKTLQLAAAGGQILAVDRSRQRVERVAENLRRTGLNADLIVADGTTWRPAEAVDAVLVDVPCTATGTIRRHPDIAHLKAASDVTALAAAQAALLAAAVAMVRPGGRIVYCACSLEPEEGEEQIARLLAAGAPVRPDPVSASEIDGLADLLNRDGQLRTLPCHLAAEGGIDGFFAARLVRT
jgi:16S rRNA (cytosine967-C5)-methyltransferase